MDETTRQALTEAASNWADASYERGQMVLSSLSTPESLLAAQAREEAAYGAWVALLDSL